MRMRDKIKHFQGKVRAVLSSEPDDYISEIGQGFDYSRVRSTPDKRRTLEAVSYIGGRYLKGEINRIQTSRLLNNHSKFDNLTVCELIEDLDNLKNE